MAQRLLLLFLLLLVWVPSQPVPAAQDYDQDEVREHLANMKQQLRELQEELAKAKAEAALQQDAGIRPQTSAWLPLTAGSPVPKGYGRYVWVLFTAASDARDGLMLSTLLDTLPERSDLAVAERTLFLVPSRSAEALALAPESYAPFAEPELLARYQKPGIVLHGPLLLTTGSAIPGSTPDLLIDLSKREATFLKQVLFLLRERNTPDSSGTLLRRLIAVAGMEPTSVRDLDGALLVSWNR